MVVHIHQLEHNHDRLRELGTAVVAIHAVHDTPAVAEIDAGQFQNLEPVLRVSIGCRVMLLNNLWTEYGLVDGRPGELTDIVWPAGLDTDPRERMPLFMLVAFEDRASSNKTSRADKMTERIPPFRPLAPQR